MRYVMLIRNLPEATEAWNALTGEEKATEIERHEDRFRRHGSEGRIAGGEELSPPDRGRIVRRRGGRVVVTDGPYAETREVLGSFILVEAPDIATVEAMAAEWPGLERWNVTIEVLPTDHTTAD